MLFLSLQFQMHIGSTTFGRLSADTQSVFERIYSYAVYYSQDWLVTELCTLVRSINQAAYTQRQEAAKQISALHAQLNTTQNQGATQIMQTQQQLISAQQAQLQAQLAVPHKRRPEYCKCTYSNKLPSECCRHNEKHWTFALIDNKLLNREGVVSSCS